MDPVQMMILRLNVDLGIFLESEANEDRTTISTWVCICMSAVTPPTIRASDALSTDYIMVTILGNYLI